MTTTLQSVISADGTSIAFESVGAGPAVVLVGGAFNDRTTVRGLAVELAAAGFTAIAFDRRGRGDSGDAAGYAVEREIEDIAALVEHAGGTAALFGHSSGAVLAIEAALHGLPITRLAVYEPPYVVEGTRARPAPDVLERLTALVAMDRRDDAVRLFMTESVGVPPEVLAGMAADPMWEWLTGLAHTLPYDVTVCGTGDVPVDRLATLALPTLAMDGGASPESLRAPARVVAAAVPGARHVTLDGEDHGVLNRPEALRGPLAELLA